MKKRGENDCDMERVGAELKREEGGCLRGRMTHTQKNKNCLPMNESLRRHFINCFELPADDIWIVGIDL